MPQKIDRIGRSVEWGTRYFLLQTGESKKDLERYLSYLPSSERRRVLVGAKKAAEKIISANEGKAVVDVVVIGEESKKPGTGDYDILVQFDDGSEKAYSLKIQKSSTGVNVRNPTLNSICKRFTGKSFYSFLTPEEVRYYEKLGEAYSKGHVESRVLGCWGAKKLASILNDALDYNPEKFIDIMLEEIRYKTNLIIVVVDNNAAFQGYVTKFVDLFARLRRNVEEIEIKPRGISVDFFLSKTRLFHIDVYMMSSSEGKGKKLRAAIRVDFEIDEKA